MEDSTQCWVWQYFQAAEWLHQRKKEGKALKMLFQFSLVSATMGIIYCDDPSMLFFSGILEFYCRIGKFYKLS